jgi:tRNA(adenine34) deaminase
MCAGAIFHARLRSVIYATADPKTGALGSVSALHKERKFNHHTEVASGLYADEAAAVLRDFFRQRR